ncbi:MAG: dTDP-4-dehydrorhamnose reductase [Clostridiales bacterium]|jgi:dTDP-4-dehydrorhamnose reductase|nr:dTDP-4-dehydrorhamnose reductase [Clostridiales bacterium]
MAKQKKRILVVGHKGMLGTDLLALLRGGEAGAGGGSAAPDGGEIEYEAVGADIGEIDITDINSVLRCVRGIRPDILINCAAYTNVNGCETETELAYQVNALGPRTLGVACEELGAPIVHISTDYVFNGKKAAAAGRLPSGADHPAAVAGGPPEVGGYEEWDATDPLSAYGKTKLAGELNLGFVTNRAYIVRTQWLYGVHGKNFVRTMLGLAKDRKEVTVVNDQFGCPTYSKDLAGAIIRLIGSPVYGLYHITNSGVTSWYEFTREIFRQAGIPEQNVSVRPCATSEYPSPAARPAYSPLANTNWERGGFAPMRPYQEALADYLKEAMP